MDNIKEEIRRVRCASPDITDTPITSQKRGNKQDKQTLILGGEEAAADFNTTDGDANRIRRSSRIKSLKGQKGHGRRREVVFSRSESTASRNVNANDEDTISGVGSIPHPSPSEDSLSSGTSTDYSGFKSEDGSPTKPFKVKSRWRDNADAELKSGTVEQMSEQMESLSTNEISPQLEEIFVPSKDLIKKSGHLLFSKNDTELVDKLKKFQGIEDSIFRKERKVSKESKGMVCDCVLTTEDVEHGEKGCAEDCLNRLLMVECGQFCPTGEHCSNKNFQRKHYATVEVFKTDKKGHGLRTTHPISEGGFVIEYVGEVLDPIQFENRTAEYAKGNQEHFYFMALKADSIIDATNKGNCSRFINHSCEPNCETQKWTVNGELRIGFFTLRDLKAGEEIVFDYQFQRYGKKAQKCYCGTPSCRGWIGEEEEEDAEYDEREETAELPDVAEDDGEKKKRKTKRVVGRRKKKDIAVTILEDVALEEELSQLERIGLKNRNHTLTLSRLMVRADKWDDRERILQILLNGDPACKRLFLDYRGLKLLYNWMVNLPLPCSDLKEQLIKNEEYHLLFLKVLGSLNIPNKTMLLDSKVLSLVDAWSNSPSKTVNLNEKLMLPSAAENAVDIPKEVSETGQTVFSLHPVIETGQAAVDTININLPNTEVQKSNEKIEDLFEQNLKVDDEKMEVDLDLSEPRNKAVDVDNYTTWTFVGIVKSLMSSWAELKEVFRIPKKERVEQMKEHEREADKGSSSLASQDSYSNNTSSYDRDGRSKWRSGRRLHTLDSYRQQTRLKDPFSHLSKEQRRQMFADKVRQEEEEMRQRRLQDDMITMHQHRCNALGLDSTTTPVVDFSGHFYLDPIIIQWKDILPNDPTLPLGIKKMLAAAAEKAKEEARQLQLQQPAEPEYVFPPWPEGLPPPPPLPPAELPDGWELALDDEGRCYYYHVRTKKVQWSPPTDEDCENIFFESSDSDSAIEDEDVPLEETEESMVLRQAAVTTLRTKMSERWEKRKRSGLVQERVISPRTEEDKSTISKAVIRARKLEVMEEKRQLRVSTSNIVDLKQSETSAAEPEKIDIASSNLHTPVASTSKSSSISSEGQISIDKDDEHMPPSPIETELDKSLATNKEYASGVSDSQKNLDSAVIIPGLGFDPRDRIPSKSSEPTVVLKKGKSSKREKKQKSGEYKKIASHKSKEAFRAQIANVVVSHLSPYTKPDCKCGKIVSTEDFKHLARKMTHIILLKELKQSREGKPLEVSENVKQKAKEYIKKFMARYGSGNYIPPLEVGDSQK